MWRVIRNEIYPDALNTCSCTRCPASSLKREKYIGEGKYIKFTTILFVWISALLRPADLFRPGDVYRIGVAVFLNGIQFGAPGAGTAALIRNLCGWAVGMDRNRDQLPIPADRRLDQVTAVVILGHPYRIPGHNYLVALADCLDVLRRPVQVGGARQPGGDEVHVG